jgi:hypothetical protein
MPLFPRNKRELRPTRRQFVLSAAALAGLGRLAPAGEPKKRSRALPDGRQ